MQTLTAASLASCMDVGHVVGTMVICAMLVMFSICGCKHQITESGIDSPVAGPAPALKDSIPYALLGSGRLAFKRYTPFDGDAFYVLDALRNASTGIAVGGMFPAISPDGEKLACTFGVRQDDPGWPWDIGVMRIDGSEFQHVTEMSWYEECPSWSADGTLIFYYHRMASSELYCQSPIPHAPDSRVFSPLTGVAPSSPVSASATGSLVLSGSAGGGTIICAVDTKGATSVIAKETSRHYYLIAPSYSPDGRRIAYLRLNSDSTGRAQFEEMAILVVNSDGTNLTTVAVVSIWPGGREITDGSFPGLSVCWSPDGRRLAFTRPSGDYRTHIWLVNVDGTGLTQVTSSPDVSDRYLTWSR